MVAASTQLRALFTISRAPGAEASGWCWWRSARWCREVVLLLKIVIHRGSIHIVSERVIPYEGESCFWKIMISL